MKKIMIVAAVAVMAISASATTLKWGLTAGAALDDTKVDKGTFYLCYSAGTVDWTKLADATSFSETTITDTLGMTIVHNGKAETTDVGDAVTFDYAKGGTVNASTFITPTDLGVTAGKFYYVCIDDGGKDMAYTASVVTQTINAQATSAAKTKGASSFTYAAAVTPEPTSAMLLLLGFAGLALRRRRA